MLKISDSLENWRVKERRDGGGGGREEEEGGEKEKGERGRKRRRELLVRRQWSMVARGCPLVMVGINTGCRRHLRR